MIAFVFPGQNSHFVGMGHDLLQSAPAAAELLRAADAVVGGGLLEVMLEGPEEALTATENQQPAILAHSIAALRLLQEAGIEPAFVAGHSLGEYSGLVAAGVVDFEEAVRLVRWRGELMARAGELAPGSMAAILGLEAAQVEQIVQQAREDEVLVVANYNSPGQVVISGQVEAVRRAGELAREAGAKRVLPLAVSGAFHSPLMQPAADEFAGRLAQVPLRPATVPVVSNADATPHRSPEEIRRALARQMTSSVLWEQSVRVMMQGGVECFVEIGPGTVLSRLINRISGDVAVYQVGDMASLQRTRESLG